MYVFYLQQYSRLSRMWILLLIGLFSIPVLSQKSAPSTIQPAVGINKFDLFLQYLGRNGGGAGGEAYQRVSKAMAKKAIIDAAQRGITYFRISATGYAPTQYGEAGDLDLWLSNPDEYWALFDEMMADLEGSGIRIIPVFVWNVLQFPAMSGTETVTDLITDSTSWSYQTLTQYITDFINRYHDHPMLYFYELSNELNDHADINFVGYSCSHTQNCVAGNFVTDDLIAFTRRLANFIRNLDPDHFISSGFNLPRRAAAHLRLTPDTSDSGDWTPDSRAQFRAHLGDIHQYVDIISIHFYNGIDTIIGMDTLRSNLRWGLTGRTNVEVLDEVKFAADSLGKLLFIGEFADQDPFITQDEQVLFSQAVLDKIVNLNIPFSAPWIWEFYQFQPHLFTIHNIEPGYSDFFIEKIKDTNRQLGNIVPEPPIPDLTPPQVVLVWPLENAVIDTMTLIAAVASDDHQVAKVEFWVDNNVEDVVFSPPYHFWFDMGTLSPGEHILTAVAYDSAGNQASFSSRVFRPDITSLPPAEPLSAFRLGQNYPNPFNPVTTITWSLPVPAAVTIKLYDVLGQEVETLLKEVSLNPGLHHLQVQGDQLPGGVYFYRMTAVAANWEFVATRKLILLK